MKKVYIFSGLGADQRVFKYIDFSGFEPVFIPWISPAPGEPIEEYAARMLPCIKEENPLVIGISFGGLMAIEVAKLIKTRKVILIASAQTRQELPFYFRLVGRLSIHKIIPGRLLKRPSTITNWFFGTESRRDEQLLTEILNDTDPAFVAWAVDKVVYWQNTARHANLRHIHGSLDRIFPIRYVHCHYRVNNAGHFLTINRADELSALIRREMAEPV